MVLVLGSKNVKFLQLFVAVSCLPKSNRESTEALLRPLSAKPVLVTFRDPKIGSQIGLGLAAHVIACTHSHKDVVVRIAAAASRTDLL